MREVEVLRLISKERSDWEIAAELFISVRTVGNHVKNILRKTDCPNRTAAGDLRSSERGFYNEYSSRARWPCLSNLPHSDRAGLNLKCRILRIPTTAPKLPSRNSD